MLSSLDSSRKKRNKKTQKEETDIKMFVKDTNRSAAALIFTCLLSPAFCRRSIIGFYYSYFPWFRLGLSKRAVNWLCLGRKSRLSF